MLGKSSSLKEGIKNPKNIKSLRLVFPGEDLINCAEEIPKLRCLKKLSIQVTFDNFQMLPPTIGELDGLEKLHLLNVPFLEIPDWLFNLKNLKNLMIRGNDLTKIPICLSNLSKLEHLRIENTKIISLPSSLQNLSKLKTLSVVDNFKLQDLDSKILPKSLKWLAIKPSGIPQNKVDQIVKENPQLKFNKRYFD